MIEMIGRGERIRTSGLFVPNEARYQAAPHLDGLKLTWSGGNGQIPPIGSFQDIKQGLDFLQLIFGHRMLTGEVELGLELFPIILRHLLAGLL